MTRRRLSPEDRRAHLLDVGARTFAELPYEGVRMDDVARRAGVSRALLYRHFPTKHDLFAEVYRSAASGLLAVSEIRSDLPFADQVVDALDAHLEYFAANRHAVLAANRELAGDPTIQAIITGELAELRRRMLDISGLTGPDRAAVNSVLAAWLVYVRVLCVDWLANDTLTRDQVRDVSAHALFGSLGALGGPVPSGDG